MEKKMTKREYFALVKEIVSASGDARVEEINAFIDHEVELLNKKSAKSGETKTQKENVEVMAKIKTALAEVGKAVTITELQNASATMAEYSNQKLSALLKKLVDAGEVVKTTEKKKSYFSLAE
jgi:DNA-binding transcriptional regulator GbsR (MarR family)